ncbi:type III-B CRISPR module RAMP protein Cmr6 [Aeropyrum pernix]|uniref:Type III-B CRISPR module RAMP protein Cmr6 n=1 Tax=Aeropyrum pernix TaxID=56636 RepID=A0A401H9S8_AERPX|nr:RAMP superfamily CRISPR-associated protein [Aeropyrum pernix]GBF09154.1 type III-B CRISPR module RAMP protein Cmr6 [Aeropyrum pernix]
MLAGPYIRGIVEEHYVKPLLDAFARGKGVDEARKNGRRRVVEAVLSSRDLGRALEASQELARELVEAQAEALEAYGFSVACAEFVLLAPGLVGTGSGVMESVFEVGLEIDPVLGLPYYPASTVKGASRAACEDLAGGGVCEVLYGSTGSASPLVFTPAYPVGCLEDLGPCTVYWGDVITPHYYRGGRAVESELDAEPNPVVHLSIAQGTVFKMCMGLDASRQEVKEAVAELLNAIRRRGEAGKRLASFGPIGASLFFTLSALYTGFAARSAKGYNIARILSKGEAERVSRSVVRLDLRLGGGGAGGQA